MNKDEIKEAINGLVHLKPMMQRQLIRINYEGLGRSDAEELGRHFDLAIKALQAQLNGEWIPVQEKCPNAEGLYNVTLNNGGVSIARWIIDDYNGDNFWIGTDYEVVAWMPLPEPWKKENAELN